MIFVDDSEPCIVMMPAKRPRRRFCRRRRPFFCRHNLYANSFVSIRSKVRTLFSLLFLFPPNKSFAFQDEYNLNPGLEWEDEFTGRYPGKRRQTIPTKQNKTKITTHIPTVVRMNS